MREHQKQVRERNKQREKEKNERAGEEKKTNGTNYRKEKFRQMAVKNKGEPIVIRGTEKHIQRIAMGREEKTNNRGGETEKYNKDSKGGDARGAELAVVDI